ncbi:MAG: DUF3857 and transglutaminase domain-containing protein [Bacteroidales bacterium]|nr:DUF3857 and transglutaminase domain-containing protein [Bacteroidales bacterium]
MRLKLLVIFVLSAGWLFAQKTDYNTAIKLLQPVTAKDYPESATISIENEEITIDKHCLGTQISESYEKVLTEQGKEQVNQVYFGYDSDYDTIEIPLIEIIKKNGEIVKIDPDKILKKVSQSAFSSFSNIYTETGWILTGSLPDIEIGDIVHQISKDITHKARMEDNFSDEIEVDNYSTVLKSFYQLTTPGDLKINIIPINKKEAPVKSAITEKDGKKVYTWTVGFIPHIIYEPNMDRYNSFAYHIMLTTVNIWEDISKWYYGLVKDHLKVNQDIKDKVAELTKDCKNNEEKIKNIFYWAAQKIRYLGVDKEKGRPGFEPHDVTYTFETRGGVCRDKAALIVAMLREAGIPSDPILISVGNKLNHEAPVMWFNHAIAVVYDKTGKPLHILDPTNETTKDYFPQYEEDCSYIIAREKGADLQVVPVSPAERNNTNITINISVDAQDNASGDIVIKYSGLADTYVRGQLMRSSPNKRKEMLQQTIAKIHPAAVLNEFIISNPENKDENISMKAKFTIPSYVEKDGNFLYVPFEASKLSISFIYNWEMGVFKLSERTYPFKLSNTFSVNISEKLNLTNPLKDVSVPKKIDMNYKGFVLNNETQLSPDKKQLNAIISFKVEEIHFAKTDYKDLKQKLSQLEKLQKLYIIGKI